MRKLYLLNETNKTPPYLLKSLQMWVNSFIQKINQTLLLTYANYDCARCEDCGRNVHDFSVPDSLWIEVYGSERGVLCYDCFCDRSDRKFNFKRRFSFEAQEK